MSQTRYRAIVKVLCPTCQNNVDQHNKIDISCRSCRFLRYQNVTDLLSFTSFLHTKFPNWIWLNVYEYIKGEKGPLLHSFKKGKEEPQSRSL